MLPLTYVIPLRLRSTISERRGKKKIKDMQRVSCNNKAKPLHEGLPIRILIFRLFTAASFFFPLA